MRKATFIVLLGAGIIFSLAGCQKGPERNSAANLIKFQATSSTPLTRTAYATGEGAESGGVHRIDWKAGDQVLVWSDEAKNQLSSPTTRYTYEVGTITTSGTKSIASAYDDNSQGLTWTEGVETFQFAACYPATGFTETTGSDGNPAVLTATIPARQAITFTNGFGSPDMSTAFMLATPVSVSAKTLVDLQFAPYYTCFEINVSSTDEVKINSVTLISETRTNGENTFGPSTVSGSFEAAMSLADTDPAWAVTVPTVTTDNAQVVATFATPVELKKAQATDAKTNEVKFLVFAVPQDITSLTMDFNLTNAANETEHRRATMTYAKEADDHAVGDPVTFAARKKHNIKGLTLAPINKEVELTLQVVEWEDVTGTVTYGPDAVINATALEYVSGAAKTEGGSRRRNNNFAVAYNPVDGVDQDPIWGYFYIFAPMEMSGTTNNTKWQITVTGAIDKMDVSVLQTNTKTTSDGKIVITGPTGGRVDFKISRKSAVTADDQIQLNFAVVMGDGRVISINSEITRRNALTITGKVGNN